MTITKEFPLEDVLTFTSGRFISLEHQSAIIPDGVLYRVVRFITGRVLASPFELLEEVEEVDRVRSLIKAQHNIDWDIDTPIGGWKSLENNEANTRAFIESLYERFGTRTLVLTGPSP